MAQKAVTTPVLRYLLGVCVPSTKQNAVKIRVRLSDFDKYLSMYFSKYEFIYAIDPDKRCKVGDTVLIQNLPEKLTRIITHKVTDVVFPMGDITDPITGKPVVAGRYREFIDEDAKLFGELESGFKYDEAPPRGTMEGIRDFTDKEINVKYNDDPKNNDDPYMVNPK
ncbi:28S ribosomal protein S17, mitochondrial [Hylaeus volcanicus]|uniref:28S ribosomal protein S17, mitochondrial n=1 Tax=Hylaeus volcanicus TaxID=313075 RepID=UPI0023B85D54|nr:28S ribosomal protein S17, mitochondrial [Hylaeus volcanicus]